MSETVPLVFEEPSVDLVDVARHAQLPYGLSDNGTVVSVKGSGQVCHIVEILDYAVEGILDDPKLAEVCVKPVAIFSIDYRSASLVVKVVRDLSAWRPCLVDTNYGDLIAGRDLTEAHLNPQRLL